MSSRCRAIVLSAALVAAPASALIVSDGDFASWTLGSYAGAGSSASTVLEPMNGNPGARLNVTTVTGANIAAGTAFKNDVSTTMALEGLPFGLFLDVLSGPGSFGDGQLIQLVIEQGGSLYTMNLSVTGSGLNSFTQRFFPGTLNAASFMLRAGGGPAAPVLDGSVATRFGFAGANQLSNMLTNFYDNFALFINEGTPTPTSTATITATPSVTSTPTITSSVTATRTATATSSVTATATTTVTHTVTRTPTLTPTRTTTATPNLTASLQAAPAIPTLSGGALLLLSAALGLFALWRLRAR